MQLEHVNPIVKSALDVLRAELNTEVKRGRACVVDGDAIGHDLTVLFAVTGALEGLVAYTLDAGVACDVASAMMGEAFTAVDGIVQSGVAEVGNVISSRAVMSLAELGLDIRIAPPVVLLGQDTRVSTPNSSHLLVPLELTSGTVYMHIALKPVTRAQPVAIA